MIKINVFIPHRWETGCIDDYKIISGLLDRSKYVINNYSIPKNNPLNHIDRRYNVDLQIASKIKYASIVVCSNRPALSGGMAIKEIKYAISCNKPIVAIRLTQYTNSELLRQGIEVISNRKDSLEKWISMHLK